MRALHTNSLAATGQLLKLSGIVYSPESLKDDLLGHPDYPSLFAVHDVLNQYGVQNAPVEVVAESLDEVPQPFLAYMNLPITGNDFAVVNKVQNGSITYTNSKGRAETLTRKDFLDRWKNVAVMVEGVNKNAPTQQAAKAVPQFNLKLFGLAVFFCW